MKRTFLSGQIIGLIVLIFVSTLSSTAQESSGKWFDGTWTGVGYQINNAGSWSIKLTCNSSENTYLIEYPTLKCSGN
jgi:hypothetical protein